MAAGAKVAVKVAVARAVVARPAAVKAVATEKEVRSHSRAVSSRWGRWGR